MADNIMQYFSTRDIPSPKQKAEVGEPYKVLADQLNSVLPAGAEKSEALRDLLKSRDSALRASARVV
jgi:hypothetical protein